jgi:tetratricopeptide (TPR) repeat protein
LRGLIYYSEKKYETSISEFDIVISKSPNHLNAIYNCALALEAAGNYNKCIAGLNKCISLKPMYVQAYTSRAYYNELIGEHAKAIKDYETSINLILRTLTPILI